ncbi:Retrotransposon-like protein 1 [Zancudomyces culisetae]|uniref:Retrotransposon-like protein 1 n=1 Tax=Zancudomyces culisetae TaxID=1213189 RepID=A0A1R1PYK6_ZANCU|nr:Retrotransposon-like protein 1 [Zancudomyces culisetae]|eukprot:OMH86021.1 Retrotransposon-like protein 1 [Zancudomyces culisetae]
MSAENIQNFNQIKLPDIKKFDGNPESYNYFVASLELQFWANENAFTTDKSKIVFIGAHLERPAAMWFQDLIRGSSEYLQIFARFYEYFSASFSDPSYQIKCANKIRKCYQGTRSIIEYATDFKMLARGAGFDDISLMDQYQRGLKRQIHQYLIMAPIPHNLDELIQTTSEIENRIIVFNNYTNNSNYNIRNSNTPRNTYFRHGHNRFGQITNEPEAMEVDINRPVVDIKLLTLNKEFVSLKCLIDSGSSENFIDSTTAKKLNLPPKMLKTPFRIESIDGNMLSTTGINHVFNDIKVLIGNGHTETINLHPIQSVRGHVILGMPWLKKHNPSINWDTFDILFELDYGLNYCVHHKWNEN